MTLDIAWIQFPSWKADTMIDSIPIWLRVLSSKSIVEIDLNAITDASFPKQGKCTELKFISLEFNNWK